ncbi:rhomboid family-domain-containing protein [Cokeromyces recurvatus]|uniref:rhomboid family-domain-containing protein n=1 Tax=Cokeromyces recurvatus TaxID=90255 RepID=UPI002220AE39|nr:rhomboid family-domain-containing protein [Cokeromyces recurvatus]KAI7906902.1 rhomboid family-domain-containing protein [Cokeromyces recurvatus]
MINKTNTDDTHAQSYFVSSPSLNNNSMPSSNTPFQEHLNEWDSHEMHQRHVHGFQKAHSADSPPINIPTTNNEAYYSPAPTPAPAVSPYYNTGQQPYYNTGQQPYYPNTGQQPYYYYNNNNNNNNIGLTSPPTQQYHDSQPMIGQQYPLIQTQSIEQNQLYTNRNLFLRFFIGPVRSAYFSYISAMAMAGALIFEFVRYHQLTGRIIETNPFNPMIGPSFQVLVNIGARFTPCIRSIPSFPSTTTIGNCYKLQSDTCTLEQLCGFNGFSHGDTPDQSFRFVLPIFLHAGVIHYLINMLTHLRLGVDLERSLGTVRYMVLYMASGIWGFVLSAMFSPNLTASMGCSGALFGLIGYMFIDVLVNWKLLPHPVRDLISLFISTIISLALGLLPGLDNFAHIGGFAVGLSMGMMIAPMRPLASKRRKIVTWILRLVALAIVAVLYIVSIREFYSAKDPSKICPNCKYLSCLPVYNWCDPI